MPMRLFASRDRVVGRVPDAGRVHAGDLTVVLTVIPLAGWPEHTRVHDPPALNSGPVVVPRPVPALPETAMLRVTRERVGAAVVVFASGEVDVFTAPALTAALRRGCLAARPPGPLVVDLTGIRFFSAAGLTALVVADRHCRRRHLIMRVVARDRCVLMPLHITGLDTLLTVTPDAV